MIFERTIVSLRQQVLLELKAAIKTIFNHFRNTHARGLPVPEYAFGALLTMVGCFAAFIIIKKPHLNLRIR